MKYSLIVTTREGETVLLVDVTDYEVTNNGSLVVDRESLTYQHGDATTGNQRHVFAPRYWVRFMVDEVGS